MRCLQPRQVVLGESDRFLGSEKWRGFKLDFEVPEDCQLQEIRLESAGRVSLEQKISGEIWFDDLAVRRTTGLTAAARADGLARGRESGEVSEPDGAPVTQEGTTEQASQGSASRDARDDPSLDQGGLDNEAPTTR